MSTSCSFRRINARASLTNAIVSKPPVPIKKPRRESIKKSSKMSCASGGLATYCCPCGPHRRATVAGLGLVGGTVRSSQDAAQTLANHSERSIVLRRRLVFNPKAIEALGFTPAEFAQRGYVLDGDDPRRAIETAGSRPARRQHADA